MVGGVCDEHKHKKRGVCKHCDVCKCCEPLESCPVKTNHVNWKRNQKRARTYVPEPAQKRARMSTPAAKNIGRQRNSGMRGRNRLITTEVVHSGDEDEDEQMNTQTKLAKVCELLDVNPKIILCPRNGYTIEDMKPGSWAAKKATRIVRAISKAVCDAVSPGNTNFQLQMTTKGTSTDKAEAILGNILSKSAKLIFVGNRKTRNVVESLMSAAVDKNFLKHSLSSECEKFVGTAQESMAKKKSVLGKVHYATSRKGFKFLEQGKDIPKHDYSFRVDAYKLSTAIEFIKESLCVKPGVVRDVTIAGHVFKSLPVYERGGKSIESLNEAYSAVYEKDQRVLR